MNRIETTRPLRRSAGLATISALALMCVYAPSSATVLKLDKNGNYVDAQTAASGPTPYAPSSAPVPALETGVPFPDPNAEVATDARRMENPASQYEIILNEVEALASPRDGDETRSEIKDETPQDIEQNFALNTAPELEPAEPGGLVFATIVKADESVPEADIDTNPTAATNTGPVVLKAMRTLEPAAASVETMDVLNGPKDFDAIILAEVSKFDNVDVSFVKAVISAESNYNTTAVSSKGAMGLMQIMPATAETYGVINPFSPEENIRAGTAELSRLMTVYKNPALALAAYNAGQGAVETHNGVPPFRETQDYIVRVLTKTFTSREQLSSGTAAKIEEVEAEKAEENPLMRPLNVQTFDW